MRPFETFPGTNGLSNFTLNHSPNSRWSVSARQTRDTGAFNSIVFSIRLDICNYLVAFQYVWIWSICNRFVAYCVRATSLGGGARLRAKRRRDDDGTRTERLKTGADVT